MEREGVEGYVGDFDAIVEFGYAANKDCLGLLSQPPSHIHIER